MPRPNPKKKKLPSLEHRYEYRSKRRNSLEGRALEALGGDKAMIAELASFGALIMSQYPVEGNLAKSAEWLGYILTRIAAGESPNEAFGWEGSAGRWKLHGGESWPTVKKSYEVGSLVERYAQSIAGKTFDDAIAQVAALKGITATQCKTAVTSVAPSNTPLSKAKALDIALDLVAAYGADGHQGIARDTAADYYKELINSRGNV